MACDPQQTCQLPPLDGHEKTTVTFQLRAAPAAATPTFVVDIGTAHQTKDLTIAPGIDTLTVAPDGPYEAPSTHSMTITLTPLPDVADAGPITLTLTGGTTRFVAAPTGCSAVGATGSYRVRCDGPTITGLDLEIDAKQPAGPLPLSVTDAGGRRVALVDGTDSPIQVTTAPADLRLTMDDASLPAGGTGTISVTATNRGGLSTDPAPIYFDFPSGVSVTGIDIDGDACATVDQGACTLPAVDPTTRHPEAQRIVTFQLEADVSAVTGDATVTIAGQHDTATLTVLPAPAVLAITPTPATALFSGGSGSASFTVTNDGGPMSAAAPMSWTPPSGVEITSVQTGGRSCVPEPGQPCLLPPLAGESSATVLVNLTASPEATGGRLTVAVGGASGSADLDVQSGVTGVSVSPGGPYPAPSTTRLTLQVGHQQALTDPGPVTLTLSGGARFTAVPADCSGAGQIDGVAATQQVTCDSATIHGLELTIDQGQPAGSLPLTATDAAGRPVDVTADNTQALTIVPGLPTHLVLSELLAGSPLSAGGSATITFTATNNGDEESLPSPIVVSTPSEVTATGVDVAGAAPCIPLDADSCRIPAIGAHQSVQLTIALTATSRATIGGRLTVSAGDTVATLTPLVLQSDIAALIAAPTGPTVPDVPPTTESPSAGPPAAVEPTDPPAVPEPTDPPAVPEPTGPPTAAPAVLDWHVTDSGGSLRAGGSASATVAITNTGGLPSSPQTVRLEPPAGIGISAITAGDGSACSIAERTCTLPPVAPGVTSTLTATVTAAPDALSGTLVLSSADTRIEVPLTVNGGLQSVTANAQGPLVSGADTGLDVAVTAYPGVTDLGRYRLALRTDQAWFSGYPAGCTLPGNPSSQPTELTCTGAALDGVRLTISGSQPAGTLPLVAVDAAGRSLPVTDGNGSPLVVVDPPPTVAATSDEVPPSSAPSAPAPNAPAPTLPAPTTSAPTTSAPTASPPAATPPAPTPVPRTSTPADPSSVTTSEAKDSEDPPARAPVAPASTTSVPPTPDAAAAASGHRGSSGKHSSASTTASAWAH